MTEDEILRSLANAVPIVLVYIGADLRYRFANRFYEDRYGRGNVVGRLVLDVVGEEQWKRVEPAVLRALAGEVVVLEAPIPRVDQSPLVVAATYVPVRGPDGTVVGIATVSEDITERRTAERLLLESERQLRLLADVIPQLVWVTAPDGRAEYMNARWYEYTGVSADAGFEAWVDVVHPDDRARVIEENRRAISEQSTFEVEYRVRRHDGVYRWHLARSVFIMDVAGKAIKRFGTGTDIDDQKRQQDRLRTLHRISTELVDARSVADVAQTLAHTLHDTLGATACAVFIENEAGDALDRAGYYAKGDDGSRRPKRVELDEPIMSVRAFKEKRAIWATDTDKEHMARLEKRTGSPAMWFRSTCAIPLVADDRVLGVVGMAFSEAHTFTADEQAHSLAIGRLAAQALARARLFEREWLARTEAERANRVKDEFLAMLGHELRNPLAPILTALQLMELRGETAVARERTIIERQVRHLSRLVDDLLDVSRIAAGRIDIERVRVDMSEVIARAVEMATPIIEQRRHHFTLDVARGLVIVGDATRMAQVISNLLANAAKYTPDGGHLALSAQADAGALVISVRDDGVGIAPDLLPRVFDLFTQGAQALDRKQGGIGLGLALARSIVELHGGTIAAKNNEGGRGTELVLRIALAAGPSEVAERSPSGRTSDVSRGKVLIVDDNEDAAELLSMALEGQGFATRIANDGAAALAIVEGFTPDLAILDIGLPVMDGYELARQLRGKSQLAKMHLVALTGYGQASDRERTKAGGFQEHLVKPVDLDRLETVVSGLIARPHPAT